MSGRGSKVSLFCEVLQFSKILTSNIFVSSYQISKGVNFFIYIMTYQKFESGFQKRQKLYELIQSQKKAMDRFINKDEKNIQYK